MLFGEGVEARQEVDEHQRVGDDRDEHREGQGLEDLAVQDPEQELLKGSAARLQPQRHRCAEREQHRSGVHEQHVLYGVDVEHGVRIAREPGVEGDDDDEQRHRGTRRSSICDHSRPLAASRRTPC